MKASNDLEAETSDATYTDHFIREVRVQYHRSKSERFTIKSPDDVANFVRSNWVDNSREQFFALYLDGSSAVAAYSLISIGVANAAMVHPREIFQRAVLTGATSFAIAHNHPSGECKPSHADHSVTRQLKKVGEMLGILLLDHVIVTEWSYHSIREEEGW